MRTVARVSTISIVAGLVTDPEDRVLLVRKHGTEAFMQPGGKPEPGEPPRVALARELNEELGLDVHPERLRPLDDFHARAANEPGLRVAAQAYALRLTTHEAARAEPCSEIAEAVWVTTEEASELPLAPLSRDHMLALVGAA